MRSAKKRYTSTKSPDEKIPKDMLELASHIVETKSGHFNPEEFEDQYEDALKELLKKKQAGVKIEAPKERTPAKVINLMDALKRSVEAGRAVVSGGKLPVTQQRSMGPRRKLLGHLDRTPAEPEKEKPRPHC
jgi:non-homologous end joining protein Ku